MGFAESRSGSQRDPNTDIDLTHQSMQSCVLLGTRARVRSTGCEIRVERIDLSGTGTEVLQALHNLSGTV